MTDVLAWTLGDRMRKARRTAGLSTADLAAELGVHQTTVTKFEADTAVPRIGYLRLWAIRCGVPLEYLIGEPLPKARAGRKARRSSTKWYFEPSKPTLAVAA
jgi:transcriptional regulator with XRE-family HTH domain